MKKTYSLRLDEDLVQEIEKIAETENRNFSNMVETILKKEIFKRTK